MTVETTTMIEAKRLKVLENSNPYPDEPPTTTNSDLDQQFSTTELPNLIDGNRNDNEIFKFNLPHSTSIIDDDTDTESSSYASYVVPLKIILPIEHVHKSEKNNSYERFNYILLKVDDANYHEHISSDNSDILYPVDRYTTPAETVTPTASNHDSNDEMVTSTVNVFDTNGSENHSNAIKTDQNDFVLVDSQGYRYELGSHFHIMDEFKSGVVEFDDLQMIRPNISKTTNQITKRILADEEPAKSLSDTQLNIDQYEGHYAKIFQWLHYHL